MDNNYFKLPWTTHLNTQITFAGVAIKYFDEFAKKNKWGEITKAQYAKNYEDNLFPRLQEHALSEYTAEDFEQIIQNLSTEKCYKYSTLQHYRRLVKHVIAFAVQNEGLANPLWGVYFDELLVPKDVAHREKTTLPRSLDPVMILKISRIIYASLLESGVRTGLALEMECGLRPKEAAATTYGDLRSYKDGESIPQVFIHNSTIDQTHDLRDGVKTDNGYRTAIISDILASSLEEKKENTKKLIYPNSAASDQGITDISRAPMVYEQKNSFRHCSSTQLSAEFRKLLAQVGYDPKEYLLLQNIVNSQDFIEAVKRVTPKELGFAEERDPSSYSLRRQLNTEMHILGMIPEDRQFTMGHNIENPDVKRSDYRNEDLLSRIAQRLNMRPYVNPSVLNRKTLKTCCYKNDNINYQDFELPNRKGTLVIDLICFDLLNPGEITLTFPDSTCISGKIYTESAEPLIGHSPNVIYDYLELHRRARDRVQAEEEAKKKEEEKKDLKPKNE